MPRKNTKTTSKIIYAAYVGTDNIVRKRQQDILIKIMREAANKIVLDFS